MAYPINLQATLHFLLGRDGRLDDSWRVFHRKGVGRFEFWNEVKTGRSQPTEQEISDVNSDITQVDGQAFSKWFAENGGDPILTRRRKLREFLISPGERVHIAALANLIGKTKGQVIKAHMDAITTGEGD